MSDCNNIPFFEDDLHCYEDFKHNHEDHKPCDDHVKCCPDADCAPLKPNCKPECCEGLPPVIPDLSKAYAVPTLVNRIFDCIKLESPHFAIKNVTFKITSTPPPPASAYSGKVCIDEVCVKYDAIGPVLENGHLHSGNSLTPSVMVCSKPVSPEPAPGSSIPYPTRCALTGFSISNNLIFNVNNTSCCYEHNHVKEGRKCKVVEQNIQFGVLELKIVVTGRIGCLPFTAQYVTPSDGSCSDLSLLGLPNTYNFFGKLCIPKSNSGITIHENFESCLSIDCVDSPSDLAGKGTAAEPYKFTANVESSLLIKKTVFALAEEKLSVLAIPTPRNQYCHKPEHDNPCHPCSYDME